MGNIVRRVAQAPEVYSEQGLPEVHTLRDDGICVNARTMLGVEPRLYVVWSVEPSRWADGYTLFIFHSTSGFSPERYPRDLNQHGQLIIEANADDYRDNALDEGTHYYTFLLHKLHCFGLRESMSQVRFSVHVPTAKIAIGRIKDQLELRELLDRHAVSGMEREIKVNAARLRHRRSRKELSDALHPPPAPPVLSATDAVIEEELAGIDALVATLAAKRAKVAALQRDSRFTALTSEEQQVILKRIEERLDPAEISARRASRR